MASPPATPAATTPQKGDPAADAATAKYIVDYGRDCLDALALGNEPSGYTPCWYSPFWTATGGYSAHPLAYGLKAFDLGGHGRLIPAAVTPGGLNVTACATRGADRSLCVTLINKGHGAGDYRRGRVMFLTAPGGDPAAKAGVTLGGGAIAEDGHWAGAWSPLTLSGNRVKVTVPAMAAAVVRLQAR